VSEELRLRELLEQLVAAKVRFVLVGGLAVNAWGYPEVPAVVTAEIGRDPCAHRGLRPFVGALVSSPISVRAGV
jgi:hypothetical protein